MSPTTPELSPGRELDALIAEKVMGEVRPVATSNDFPEAFHGAITGDYNESANGAWRLTVTGYDSGDDPVWEPKPYSTDIRAAWEVVEKIPGLVLIRERTGWTAQFDGTALSLTELSPYGETAPLAICRAALKAVGSGPPVR